MIKNFDFKKILDLIDCLVYLWNEANSKRGIRGNTFIIFYVFLFHFIMGRNSDLLKI